MVKEEPSASFSGGSRKNKFKTPQRSAPPTPSIITIPSSKHIEYVNDGNDSDDDAEDADDADDDEMHAIKREASDPITIDEDKNINQGQCRKRSNSWVDMNHNSPTKGKNKDKLVLKLMIIIYRIIIGSDVDIV